MKKVLYSLLIFVSIFFVVDKAKALPDLSLFNDGSLKVHLGNFIHNKDGKMPFYGFSGSDSYCGTYNEPNSSASINCWYDSTLSLVASNYDGGVNPSSWGMEFFPQYTFENGHVYKATIVGHASNTTTGTYFSTDKIKSINGATIISSKTEYSFPEVKYTVVFKMNESINDNLTVSMTHSDINYRDFDDAWAYLFMPDIKETLYYEEINSFYDDTKTIYFDVENSNAINVIGNLESKLNEIIDYYENNNPYNHKLVIYIYSTNSILVRLLPSSFVSNMGSNYCFYALGDSTSSKMFFGCQTNTKIKSYTFNGGSDISQFKTDMLTEFSSISGTSTGYHALDMSFSSTYSYSKYFVDNKLDYFSIYSFMTFPYYSDVPIYNYYTSSSVTYYKIQFGDVEVPFGGYLEPSKNYFKEDEPEPNVFEEQVDDIDYSKMIFDFDVNVFKERGNIFDYLIDFETIGTIQEDMSLNESHIQKFSSPYIEYVDENGVSRKLDIDFGYDEQLEVRSAWYVAQNQEISSNIISLKLIVPMDKTSYARYKINLVSYIPFTTYYVTNDEALSYYANVDLTNKYGVVFMPKLIENNSDISSIFYTTGIESVLVYSSYDYKEQPVEIYDSNLSEFNYTISYENINYNLVFKVNSLTPNLGIVTYDTRYYTYKIIDSKYSLGNIINPNTGENHYVDFSNTSNVKMNFDDIGDVFFFISEKIDSGGESYLLFKDSVSTFFNTMPTDIYILILTVLAVILIGTALALGGWK